MASSSSLRLFCLLPLVIFCLLNLGRSDIASDEAECQSQLVGLVECLDYVRGDRGADAPTPACCVGMKQVVVHSFKCVCVLIQDRDAPQLNLKINVTRALTLSSTCNAAANISDCPRLLGIPLNSTEARIFQQFANESRGSGGSVGVGGKSTGSAVRSKRWLGMEMDDGILWMPCLLLPLLLLVFGG